jgi:hypothetical protein
MSPIDLWVMNMATIVQGFHLGFVWWVGYE